MPSGIYKHKPTSEETKRKISISNTGKIPSEESKEKNRLAHLGNTAWNKGIEIDREKYPTFGHFKKHSEESRRKIGLSGIGHSAWNKGKTGYKVHTIESRKKISIGNSGEKSHLWRGGITSINMKIRNTLEMRLWREAVFKRDEFTCIWCGQFGGTLNADHIKSFSQFPELRFSIDNGRTLCIDCHKTTDTYLRNYKKK